MKQENSMYKNAEIEENTNSIEVDIVEIVWYLLSRWYMLIISAVVAMGLVLGADLLFVAPKYQSSVTFNVENTRETSKVEGVTSSDIVAAESLAETYKVILSSNSVRERVVESLAAINVAITENQLSNAVAISEISNTQILRVDVTHKDEEMAYTIAKTYEKVVTNMIIHLTNWGNAYVIDSARMPKKPSSPRVERDAVIGFMAGMALCVLILLIIRFSDRRIFVAEDIENALNVTVIGQIPKGIVTEGEEGVYRAEGKRGMKNGKK